MHVTVIQGLPGHLLDPYYWVRKHFELVPGEADKPAFGYVVDGVYTPLTYVKLSFKSNNSEKQAVCHEGHVGKSGV
jgi:hypothetical protein